MGPGQCWWRRLAGGAGGHRGRAGAVVNGEVARLVDRGYQKFIKTANFELPASAKQLQGVHSFSEELKQLIGAVSFYNELLGTTSDLYQYDRLKGREAAQAAAARPWESPRENTESYPEWGPEDDGRGRERDSCGDWAAESPRHSPGSCG